jgi:hypothetical protein
MVGFASNKKAPQTELFLCLEDYLFHCCPVKNQTKSIER